MKKKPNIKKVKKIFSGANVLDLWKERLEYSLWMIFLNPKKKEKKKNADSTVGYKVSKKSQHQQNNSIG